VLSGVAVHFRDNWETRRVLSMNFNRNQTLASLQRIATVLEERKAQLWIGHDKAQSAQLPYPRLLRIAARWSNVLQSSLGCVVRYRVQHEPSA
jgi:glyoxylase-like metal-dependent hydrolase (beta-lactamase superfamily II)